MSSVSGLVFVALELGLVALVLVLLNARDRRRDRTAAVVLGACATASRRGGLALHVRASLLSSHTVAVLDMSACGAGEVWSLMRRLADILPCDVVLVIHTRVHGPRLVTITLRRPPGAYHAISGRRPSSTASGHA